jgi:hypothetical protein
MSTATKPKLKSNKNEIDNESQKLIDNLNEKIADYVKRRLFPFAQNRDLFNEALDNIMENVMLSVDTDVQQLRESRD